MKTQNKIAQLLNQALRATSLPEARGYIEQALPLLDLPVVEGELETPTTQEKALNRDDDESV